MAPKKFSGPPNRDKNPIGHRIWHARKLLNLSQEQLADRASGPKKRIQIQRAEAGRNKGSSVGFRQLIANGFGVSRDRVERYFAGEFGDGEEGARRFLGLQLTDEEVDVVKWLTGKGWAHEDARLIAQQATRLRSGGDLRSALAGLIQALGPAVRRSNTDGVHVVSDSPSEEAHDLAEAIVGADRQENRRQSSNPPDQTPGSNKHRRQRR